MATPVLENKGSLISYKEYDGFEERDVSVGYLFNFKEKGVFAPTGKVDVTPDEALAHNEALDKALIEGLDNNCEIGQGGMFYFKLPDIVHAWNGTFVASAKRIGIGKDIKFERKGKVFRGRLQKDADCFNFRRVK